MLSQEQIKRIFAKANAIITDDHFVYAKKPDGWYHGYDYVNKDAIYPFTTAVSELCQEIACHFREFSFETVVGPTVGGVSLAQWTAYCLSIGSQPEVLAICADEEDILEETSISQAMGTTPLALEAFGKVRITASALLHPAVFGNVDYFAKKGTRRVIKRGYDKFVKEKRCLIVEDVINSGATVVKTRDAVITAGGEVVGVGCLCNRSGGKVTAETLGVPELFSLLDLDMKMFPEAECPICRERGQRSVRTDIGKGEEFLKQVGLAPKMK